VSLLPRPSRTPICSLHRRAGHGVFVAARRRPRLRSPGSSRSACADRPDRRGGEAFAARSRPIRSACCSTGWPRQDPAVRRPGRRRDRVDLAGRLLVAVPLPRGPPAFSRSCARSARSRSRRCNAAGAAADSYAVMGRTGRPTSAEGVEISERLWACARASRRTAGRLVPGQFQFASCSTACPTIIAGAAGPGTGLAARSPVRS
jgi:hypothetical protein